MTELTLPEELLATLQKATISAEASEAGGKQRTEQLQQAFESYKKKTKAATSLLQEKCTALGEEVKALKAKVGEAVLREQQAAACEAEAMEAKKAMEEENKALEALKESNAALVRLREEEAEKARAEAAAALEAKATVLARLQESEEGAKRLAEKATALEAEKAQQAAAAAASEEERRALAEKAETLEKQLSAKEAQLREAEEAAKTPVPAPVARLPSVEVEVTTGVDAVAMPAGYAREEANHDARLSRGRGVAA